MDGRDKPGHDVRGHMDIILGTLQHLPPRDIWKNEASDFTPWVAEHIGLLGEALGLDLEFVVREQSVGEFSCDVVAREIGRNRPVIIENQLEATDHRHLGQLLTYASGLDAAFIIWISPEIREEHRQALDWLNRHTDESVDFFGVQLEAIRIDDSRPAVQFRLMAFPNEWGKAQGRAARIVTSTTGDSIPQLKSHRTRWINKLETATDDDKPLIRQRIADYDRRIAEAEEQARTASPSKRTILPIHPEGSPSDLTQPSSTVPSSV